MPNAWVTRVCRSSKRGCHLRVEWDATHAIYGCRPQAIFFRRRHQLRRPPLAKIRPGRPAPVTGTGTALGGAGANAMFVSNGHGPNMPAVTPIDESRGPLAGSICTSRSLRTTALSIGWRSERPNRALVPPAPERGRDHAESGLQPWPWGPASLRE
jgi:hypothetical protein